MPNAEARIALVCVCVGVAGRLDEIIGNRNTHTHYAHSITHTHRRRSSFRAGGGTTVILKWPVAPNNSVNTKVLKPSYASVTMVKKITTGQVHVQRALIIFANSGGSGEPVYINKTAQTSLFAHTIYDKDPEI